MSQPKSDDTQGEGTAAEVESVIAPENNPHRRDHGLNIAAVHRFTRSFLAGVRDIPVLGSTEWCALADTDRRKIAAMIVAAMARLILPQDVAGEVQRTVDGHLLKETANAISAAENWTAIAAEPSHAELQRRRARLGPLAGVVDRESLARWVATGSSCTGRR